MIEEIINGIAKSLYDEFGEGYHIYSENTESGIKEPCFIINVVSKLHERTLMDRFNETVPVCVQYFTKRLKRHNDHHEVIERLENCLEFIEMGDSLIKGGNTSGEVIDGVLNFNITYSYRTMKKFDETQMEDIEYEETVKGVN